MRRDSDGDALRYAGRGYTATVLPERQLVLLERGAWYYGLCMLSAVDAIGRRDRAPGPPERPRAARAADGTLHLTWTCPSTVWRRKTHHLWCAPEHLEFWTEVEGRADVDRAYYFRGTLAGREVASVPGWTRIWSPQPNFIEKQEVPASEYAAVAVGNDPRVLGTVRGQGLHGAPLCFLLGDHGGPWLSAGILARPGDYRFHAFEINHRPAAPAAAMPEPIVGTQAFSLAYHGHQRGAGCWATPRLRLAFAGTRPAALADYLRALDRAGGCVPRAIPYPDWTFEPIYCTWHDQVARATRRHAAARPRSLRGPSPAAMAAQCTQPHAARWLRRLARHGLHPGTVILDAGWQRRRGDPIAHPARFPDLRGFIDACHRRGQRVILWVEGWSREGLPDAECLTLDGRPAAPDPTHPAYRARAARLMRRLLSPAPGCYNADGLKLDGMTGTPGGPGLRTAGNLAGFELARALIALFHEAAHAVKPDCALGQFTACPYFADLCDLARAGDLYTVRGDPLGALAFRVGLQRLVMPGVAIDTDGAAAFAYARPLPDIWRAQARLGVPCLYQAEWLLQHRDFCRPLLRRMRPADYAAIAAAWRAYRRRRAAPPARRQTGHCRRWTPTSGRRRRCAARQAVVVGGRRPPGGAAGAPPDGPLS